MATADAYAALSDTTSSSSTGANDNSRSSGWGDAADAARLGKQRALDEWTAARYVAYGVGHVLNDMCASTWFSYLLVFLRQVPTCDLHTANMETVQQETHNSTNAYDRLRHSRPWTRRS